MLARRCINSTFTRGFPTLCALSRQNSRHVKNVIRHTSTIPPAIPNPVPPPAAPGSQSNINVSVTCNETPIAQHSLVHLQLAVPSEDLKRTPCDICCVIDVSGSMSTEAYVTNTSGATESHGMTTLDVVKHAVKTLSHSMGPEDRMAVVVYSTTAEVLSDLRYMDDATKGSLDSTLNLLKTRDSTNMWDGMQLGAQILQKGYIPGRLSSMFLLTDGMANVSPPRGEVGQFQKLKDDTPIPFSLNTFGFGYYGIDSELLHKLAIEGNGMFSFIPDSSMVGTVFVNSIANAYTAVSNNAQFTISTHGNTQLDSVYGKQKVQLVNSSMAVEACSMQIGQTKDFIFSLSSSSPPPPRSSPGSPSYNYPSDHPSQDAMQYSVKFQHHLYQSPTPTKVTVTNNDGKLHRKHADTEFHNFRLEAVEALLATRFKYDPSSGPLLNKAYIAAVANRIIESKTTDPRTLALLEDLTGQASIAVENNSYFSKWGRHYLLALARAHQLQQCSNFKDPGVQVYGGTLFKQLRDKVEELYLGLPPPKPSGRPYLAGTFSMSSYYDPDRPCFHGESTVLMEDGSLKLVKDIKKGDKVRAPSGKGVEIECVVKTLCSKGQALLCNLSSSSSSSSSSLFITPYHPVRIEGVWTFPCDIAPATRRACDAVYSFVMRAEHVVEVGGVACVTLAHGIEENAAVRHPYFGTSRVREDLQRFDGWARGMIVLEEGCMVRDKETGLVCGLRNEVVIQAA